MHPAFVARSKAALPIWFVSPSNFAKVCDGLNKSARAFVKASGFEPRPGQHLLLPAHAAALGITFYTGDQFPQRFRNGGFVALHGSWNRSVASGYKVVFFPMVNGKPGPIEDFLTGFLASDGSNNTSIEQWGRPVGVVTARDGACCRT